MALGATHPAVSRMVLREALGMTCGGLVIGVPVAYWGKRLAASLIQDLPVKSAFPIVFAVAAMIAVALLALTCRRGGGPRGSNGSLPARVD